MKNILTTCCYAKIYFKGIGEGLWCSECDKESFSTIDKDYVEYLKSREKLKQKKNEQNI